MNVDDGDLNIYEYDESDPLHQHRLHSILEDGSSLTTRSSFSLSLLSTTFRWSQVIHSIRNILLTTFLPIGYPDSVRPEYLEYQAWDCIQGISSYLRSVLTTKSLLQGAGVGSAEATPMAAALIWVFKDGIGMIGSLLFAYTYSDCFEMYTKEWRLLADVLNNVGLTLDLLTSVFPRYYLLLTSISTLSKSCCGLLAGATKARISAHFALRGHLADVTAKESTQETAVALCGLLLGMVLAQALGSGEDDRNVWVVFSLLLILHQYSNYRLIRVLVFETLNPQRCFILTHLEVEGRHNTTSSHQESPSQPDLVDSNTTAFPSPIEVARKESIFRPLYLSWFGPRIGCPLESIIDGLSASCAIQDDSSPTINNRNAKISSRYLPSQSWQRLAALWKDEEFIIGLDSAGRVAIALRQGCREESILKGYLMGCFVFHRLHQSTNQHQHQQRKEFLASMYATLIDKIAGEALRWFESRARGCIWGPRTSSNLCNKGVDQVDAVEESTRGRTGRTWNVEDILANIKPCSWRFSVKQMLNNWRISNAGLQNLMTKSSESHNSASFLRCNAENGATKFKFFSDSERKNVMTFDQALRKFVESDFNFISLVNNVLLSNGSGAIFLECAPFSTANIDKKQFEFVIMPASVLDRNKIDIVPFFDKFTNSFNSPSEKNVTVFQNLDRTSSLIVPCPVDQRGDLADPKTIRGYDHLQYMTHLTSFIGGPKDRTGEFRTSEQHRTQVVSLWENLGKEALRLSDAAARSKDEDKPYWISTDGRGVSWLHLRIDPSPKYYKFSEYKAHKREPPKPLSRTPSGHFQQQQQQQQRTNDADESRSIKSVRGNAATTLPAVTSSFVVGDKVEAKFQGMWFPGKITFNRPDGCYDILFDDGCSDRFVHSSCLRFIIGGALAKKISPRKEEGSVASEYKSNGYHTTTTTTPVASQQQQYQQDYELTPRALSQKYKAASHGATSLYTGAGQSSAYSGVDGRQQQPLQQQHHSYSFNNHSGLQSNYQPGPFSSTPPVSQHIHQPTHQLPVRPAQQVVSVGSGLNTSTTMGNRFNFLAAGADLLQQTRADIGSSVRPRSKSAPRYF